MSQTDTMAVSPRNTISREELLALKKRMNAKALTRRRLRTGGLLVGNVVMAYCIYKYYSRSPPGPFCRLYPG